MTISRDKIDEVLFAANIVDVIGGYVRLKKAGRNFIGLCPFHTEKTPSFSVSLEKSLFKCFGCGRGGNVLTFLMEHQKIPFVDAIQQLATRYGIRIPKETARSQKQEEGKELLFAATQFAADYYQSLLSKPGGEEAAQYLKRRKWSDTIQKKFLLGFAADEWEGLLDRSSKSGLAQDAFISSGLLIKRDDGKMYDRFRHRIIFPIHSPFGKIIGFGARAIKAGDEPKYLNSPETGIYNKSQALYGLFQASQAIREKDSVIIVEGYADVLSVYQSGLQNVVATSGTALTPDQIRLLSRYTKNFYFIYDADSAGANAMVRGIEVIIEQGFDVKIVQLPSGEDPDSFVQSRGRESLEESMQSAELFVDFILSQAQMEGKDRSPEHKSQALKQVILLLAKMDDELRRTFYIKHISERYDVYETVLHRELEKQRKELNRSALRSNAAAKQRITEPDDAAPARNLPMSPGERDFLSNIFQSSDAVRLEILGCIHVDDFQDERVRRILQVLMEQREIYGKVQFAQLEVDLDDIGLQRLVADLSIPKYSVSHRWEEHQIVSEPNYRQMLLDNYKLIVLRQVDSLVQKNQLQMKAVRKDEEALVEMIKEYQSLLKFKEALALSNSFEALEQVRRQYAQKEIFSEQT